MRAVLLAPLLALLAPLSGCLSCEPLLEVRHCLDHQCVPSADAVEVTWSDEDAATWPDVDAILATLPAGEHQHREWSGEREEAFWTHYGVGGEEKELIVHHDDGRYRVRVLACD